MMQHVRELPRTQSLSAGGSLRFQWEKFSKIVRELIPLWQRHWEEIALDRSVVPLDPDFDSYYRLENDRLLHVLTARSHAGELVGYTFNIIGPHLHYQSTRTAHTDMFWLAPEYRHGWRGFRLLKYTLAGLKRRGVRMHTINFKLGFQDGRVGKLLKRLGYAPTDIIMRKLIEEDR